MLRGIERKVADLEERGALLGTTPQERADARVELLEGEGLREVVVRSGVEAPDAVLDGVARGEHQDRRPRATLPEAPADVEPVGPGAVAVQDDVEHHRVVGVLLRHPERVLSVRGHVDGVALLGQAAAEEGGHLDGVLDHEETHLGSSSPGFPRVRALHEGEMKSCLE